MKRLTSLRASIALIAVAFGLSLALATLVPTSATAQESTTASQSYEEWLKEYNALAADADAKLDEYLTKLAMKEAMTDYGAENFAKALPVFKKVSIQGTGFDVTAANFLLGQMYETGLGVEANEVQAVGYYSLAATAGWADANYNLGNIYYNNRNFAGATKAFRAFLANPKAADAFKSEARYKLGTSYNFSAGIAQDYALAAEQFALASNVGNGHNKARYELGMLYLKGNGVGQDFTSAANYFQKAALYNEAADQPGVPDAQYVLSTLYAAGKGVTQSDADAVRYLRMAAKEDHIKAQFGLGMMYAAGRGVPQSIPVAYLWFARAAEGDAAFRSYSQTTKTALSYTNGTAEAVKARDTIRARMTPEQITEAQVLVDRCVSSKYACNWGE
jgi:uncharacterized protein